MNAQCMRNLELLKKDFNIDAQLTTHKTPTMDITSITCEFDKKRILKLAAEYDYADVLASIKYVIEDAFLTQNNKTSKNRKLVFNNDMSLYLTSDFVSTFFDTEVRWSKDKRRSVVVYTLKPLESEVPLPVVIALEHFEDGSFKRVVYNTEVFDPIWYGDAKEIQLSRKGDRIVVENNATVVLPSDQMTEYTIRSFQIDAKPNVLEVKQYVVASHARFARQLTFELQDGQITRETVDLDDEGWFRHVQSPHDCVMNPLNAEIHSMLPRQFAALYEGENVWVDYNENVYIKVHATWVNLNMKYTAFDKFTYHLANEHLAELKRFKLARQLQEN